MGMLVNMTFLAIVTVAVLTVCVQVQDGCMHACMNE